MPDVSERGPRQWPMASVLAILNRCSASERNIPYAKCPLIKIQQDEFNLFSDLSFAPKYYEVTVYVHLNLIPSKQLQCHLRNQGLYWL